MYYAVIIADYAALAVLAVCMFLVEIHQSSQSQKLMSSLCSWCCFVTFGFCIKITNTSLDVQILGQKIVFVGLIHAIFFMLLFIFDFCNKEIPGNIQLSLNVNNILLSVMALFLDKHLLFYKSMGLETVGDFTVLRRTYGPLHSFYIGELIVYLAVMIYTLINSMRNKGRQRIKASLLLLVAIAFPFTAYLIQRTKGLPFDLIPLSFIPCVIIILHLIYVERIYNVNDVALNYIVDHIDSAFIVTDNEYRFKGCNALAKQILPETSILAPDENLYYASSTFRQIVNGGLKQIGYEGKLYEPSIRKIYNGRINVANVITLTNVTSQFEYKALQDGYREELEAEVEKQTKYAQQRHKRVEQMSVQLVQTLANAIDAKDKYTNGHSSRVAEYSVRVATAMGWDKESVDILRYEGLLHDIGKIGISDVILNKASSLSDDEFDILKDHVTIGGDIMHDATTLPGAENVIRYHHERYDGSGYPDRLKGEQIPVDARIVSIADTYDAMSSNRVYRKALSRSRIREEMLKGRGRQFDPKILDVFISLFDRGLLEDVAPRDNGWFD